MADSVTDHKALIKYVPAVAVRHKMWINIISAPG